MATSVSTHPIIFNTDAEFRVWASMISTALAAMGWVKTADTGQIDLATVLKPGAGSTVAGYEIWRMNDALQATAPVFLKMEYGTSSSGATVPAIWTTLGQGSNGAGSLTGNLSVRIFSLPGASDAVGYLCNFSGAANRFIMTLWRNAGSGKVILFSVERTHDANGNDTAEGLLIIRSGGSSSVFSTGFLSFAAGAAAEEANMGVLAPLAGGSSGADVNVFPIFLNKGVFLNPSMNLLAYYDPTIGQGSNVAFTFYGATRTFLPMGKTPYAAGCFRTNIALALMMRNE